MIIILLWSLFVCECVRESWRWVLNSMARPSSHVHQNSAILAKNTEIKFILRTDSVLIWDIDTPDLSLTQLTAPSFVRWCWSSLGISWTLLEFVCCILLTIGMVNLWQIGCHVQQCDPWWLHRQRWMREEKKKEKWNNNLPRCTMDFSVVHRRMAQMKRILIKEIRRKNGICVRFFNIRFSRQICVLHDGTRKYTSHSDGYLFFFQFGIYHNPFCRIYLNWVFSFRIYTFRTLKWNQVNHRHYFCHSFIYSLFFFRAHSRRRSAQPNTHIRTRFISFSLSFDRIYSTHMIRVHTRRAGEKNSREPYRRCKYAQFDDDDNANRIKKTEQTTRMAKSLYTLSLTSSTVGLIWIRIVLLNFWCRILLLQRRNNAWNFYWNTKKKNGRNNERGEREEKNRNEKYY